jgi:hypothetical protein
MNTTARRYAFLPVFFMIFCMLAPATADAFRSTKQESFTDPDYLEFKPKTVVILVRSDNLEMRKIVEKRVTSDLEKRGIKVFLMSKLFPPTREWDDAQRSDIYKRYSIDAGIIVAFGESSQKVSQIGSRTWGNATANTRGNATANTRGSTTDIKFDSTTTAYGSSTTTAIVTAKGDASFSAIMVDVREQRIAWTTDIYTKAGGTLFVGGKGDAKAAAKAVVKGLIADGHIPKK